MPFIDDALLWCPDNDGRMVGGLVDITTCLQDTTTNNVAPQNQSADVNSSNNCELNSLDNLGDSSEELFRQLEGSFEIESLLSDLTTEVKQEDNNNNLSGLQEHHHHHLHHQLLSQQGFNDNNNQQQSQYNQTETALLALAASVTAANSNQQQQQQQQQISSLHRNYVTSTTGDNTNSVNNGNSSSSNSNGSRYSIAANPLLAEKLLSPNSTASLNDLDNLSIGGVRSGRPPDLKGR
ncbi:hypothetical protein ACFFRR_010911 [Megaselia abdita]